MSNLCTIDAAENAGGQRLRMSCEKRVESDRFEQVSGQLLVFGSVTSRVIHVFSPAAAMAGTPH
jgi:hypothetical protein